MNRTLKKLFLILLVSGLSATMNTSVAQAIIYDAGVAPTDATLVFGDHLVGAVPHTSVAGVGGSGLSNNGDALNGSRTYIWDKGASLDLADGTSNRSDAGFAMMIWDFGSAYDSMRLYPDQDHYFGGPVTDPFVAQDLMEYSVWGSSDGDNFVLLSDVTAFDMNGAGAGIPTYTFVGTSPSIVYRGGSQEYALKNAYTREYVFSSAYRYYGVRTSTVSLLANDADPELDTIAAFNIANRPDGSPGKPTSGVVPEPATMALFGIGSIAGAFVRRKRVA